MGLLLIEISVVIVIIGVIFCWPSAGAGHRKERPDRTASATSRRGRDLKPRKSAYRSTTYLHLDLDRRVALEPGKT
jgi:hypothetical protein